MKKLGIITSIAACAFLAMSAIPAGAQTTAGSTDASVPVAAADTVGTPAPASVTTNLNLFPSLVPKPPAAASSSSDSTHRFEVFAGYSFLNNNIAAANDTTEGGDGPTQLLHGYAASVTFNLNKNFGILADFSGHNGGTNSARFGTDQDEDQYYFLFGPVVSHSFGKARISGHVTVGVAKQRFSETGEGSFGFRDTNFAAGVGGSFDWMFSDRWGWRVLQFDYLTSIFNGDFASGRVNNVRGSTGIIVRFK
jgi:hypothetical protein